MREKPSPKADTGDRQRLMRFDRRETSRVGDMLCQTFAPAERGDPVEREFERMLRKI